MKREGKLSVDGRLDDGFLGGVVHKDAVREVGTAQNNHTSGTNRVVGAVVELIDVNGCGREDCGSCGGGEGGRRRVGLFARLRFRGTG